MHNQTAIYSRLNGLRLNTVLSFHLASQCSTEARVKFPQQSSMSSLLNLESTPAADEEPKLSPSAIDSRTLMSSSQSSSSSYSTPRSQTSPSPPDPTVQLGRSSFLGYLRSPNFPPIHFKQGNSVTLITSMRLLYCIVSPWQLQLLTCCFFSFQCRVDAASTNSNCAQILCLGTIHQIRVMQRSTPNKTEQR